MPEQTAELIAASWPGDTNPPGGANNHDSGGAGGGGASGGGGAGWVVSFGCCDRFFSASFALASLTNIGVSKCPAGVVQ